MVAVDLVLDTIEPETRLKKVKLFVKNERLHTPFGCQEEVFVSGSGGAVQMLSQNG